MANSTQMFEPQNDEDEEGSSPYGGPQATQAFPVTDGDEEYEDDQHPAIQQTQAFDGGNATQAFSMGSFDVSQADDPMLYGEHVTATQHFSVAEYAVVGDEHVANTSGTSDVNYDVSSDNQQFLGGVEEVIGNQEQVEGSFDGMTNEYDVAGEEVVAGDEAGSNIGDMDEIASPDPEEEQEEDQEQEQEAEEQEGAEVRRANRISSDDEGEKEDGDSGGESPSKRAKTSKRYVDDDEDGEERAAGEQAASDDDDADADKKSEVGELIANIFGDSDEEAAVSDADEPKEGHSRKTQHAASDSETKDSDDVHDKLVVAPDFISDFDLMMERRRAENRRRYRKRKDYDIVNDSDDIINDLITQMKQAAKADAELNRQQKPALSKRKLLPTVVKQLKKSDLQSAFIELGVVTVIADWLVPLPDGSLPALEIRTELLKVLQQFPTLDHQILKSSSIGKAVMILYKHPKEIKENKERAGKLINEWARPIFSLQSDYRSLSKEERLQRDYEHMPLAKKRRMSSVDAENKAKTDAEGEEERPLRPGDKGWIGRARVPQPSTKDYVVRPKWNVESEVRNTSSKRGMSAMDRKLREIKERTKPKKAMRAVGVSIEGRKMP